MKVLTLVLCLFVSATALGQTRVVSIDAFDLSYTGGLVLRHDHGRRTDRDEATFRLNLNYAQNFEQYLGLMWKAQVNLNRTSVDYGANDVFESRYGAAGGFLYNFQHEDIKNSMLAGAMAGIERATYEVGSADDESGFNLFAIIEGGKRWDLGGYSAANISYAPTVSVMFKRYGGGIRDDYFKTGNEVRFNFLKFDILF